MTRDEILSGLKLHEPWFHRIDLGDGIFTKTESVMGEPVDHPRESWEAFTKTGLTEKEIRTIAKNIAPYMR